jgi:protease IV
MHAARSLLGLLLLNLPARLLRFLLEWRRSKQRAILRLRLAGEIVEERGGKGGGLIRQGRIHLPSLVALLRRAGTDPSVEAVTLYIGSLSASWAQLEEIREAIALLRERGRSVHAYLERPGHTEYFLATACDRIATSPLTSIGVVGLRSEVTFFKGAMDLLGVRAHFEAAGEYKSFGEPFTRDSMSDAYRESLDTVLRATHEAFIAGVADGRGMEPSEVQARVDDGPWSAEEALAAGLVDEVLYPDRWKRALRKRLGDKLLKGKEGRDDAAPDPEAHDQGVDADAPPGRRRLNFRSAVSWLRPWAMLDRLDLWGRPTDLVAVVVATGSIIDSDSAHAPRGRIAVRPLAALITAVRTDPRVKAVVLRVDSPGGSGLASDLLWRELRRLRKKKPLVASMGGVAASGGYYLSMAADRIYADAGTITGSIGVVAGKFEISGLLDKVGLKREVFSYGANTGLFAPTEGLTDSTRAKLREQLEVFYKAFVGKAASCRDQEFDALEQHAQGRIWTGQQAAERGLIDEVGSLRAAIHEAADRGGCRSGWRAIALEVERPKWWARAQNIVPGANGAVKAATDELTNGWSEGGLIQARLPFDLRIL